jgi:ribose transport system ATP-binding protein
MSAGRLTGFLSNAEANQENIMELATQNSGSSVLTPLPTSSAQRSTT